MIVKVVSGNGNFFFANRFWAWSKGVERAQDTWPDKQAQQAKAWEGVPPFLSQRIWNSGTCEESCTPKPEFCELSMVVYCMSLLNAPKPSNLDDVAKELHGSTTFLDAFHNPKATLKALRA